MSSSVSRSFAARAALCFALGALLLRLLVPVGTMPAALAGGWFLQLCPDGLPAETLARLLGDSHHHHHHAVESGERSATPVRCDLGAALSGDALKPDVGVASVSPPVFAEPFDATDLGFEDGPSFPPFRSRAPPLLV